MKSHLFNGTVRMQNVDSLVCLSILAFFDVDQTFATDWHEDVILFNFVSIK